MGRSAVLTLTRDRVFVCPDRLTELAVLWVAGVMSGRREGREHNREAFRRS